MILGQWSGECEVPTGYWMEDGRAVAIDGGTEETAGESFVIGWSPMGEAVALLWPGICGIGAPVPGVYLAHGRVYGPLR